MCHGTWQHVFLRTPSSYPWGCHVISYQLQWRRFALMASFDSPRILKQQCCSYLWLDYVVHVLTTFQPNRMVPSNSRSPPPKTAPSRFRSIRLLAGSCKTNPLIVGFSMKGTPMLKSTRIRDNRYRITEKIDKKERIFQLAILTYPWRSSLTGIFRYWS